MSKAVEMVGMLMHLKEILEKDRPVTDDIIRKIDYHIENITASIDVVDGLVNQCLALDNINKDNGSDG